ncbi:MAG: metal ABC transporter permease [Bacteroidia bacterium]|nr:metal ABC transporter permease [Bacteroidia bacterium]
METAASFFLLQDPNVTWVVMGVVLICASAAVTGTFTLLRKQALIGDAVAHSILPGVCIAFMLTGSRHPLVLMTGAFAAGWISLQAIQYLDTRTKIKGDAALALVLSVFYGLGILLLTAIQRSGLAAQSGLDKFLLGKAASLVAEDVQVFAGFAGFLIISLLIAYRPLKILIFDRAFAQSRGLQVRALDLLLAVLTVTAISLGIQAVGVVLMAALLIAPAAAARYWTHDLRVMLVIAAGLAAVSGVAGAYISYLMPNMPTGPWIVVALSVGAFLSVLLGTEKGILAAWLRRRRIQARMDRENLLKCLYQLGEADGGGFLVPRTREELLARRAIPDAHLNRAIRQLLRLRLLSRDGARLALTAAGISGGKRIVRLHRLWELYLTTHLLLPADHVHEDAEAMEHVITPEIEQQLAHRLDFPARDPHAAPIPEG